MRLVVSLASLKKYCAQQDKGVPWGIVTNKPRYLAELLLETMQLDERCSVLVCPDDVSRSKPDPEPMYMALEKLAIPRGAAESVLYIGDHIRDIEAEQRRWYDNHFSRWFIFRLKTKKLKEMGR